MMPDYPITETERQQWREYRQQLRDFPAVVTKENIEQVSFPGKPVKS
jgi:hypothetical protein